MINLLNNNEISSIAGGYICDSTYGGQSFKHAKWHIDKTNEPRKKYGECHYAGRLYYNVPEGLKRSDKFAMWSLSYNDDTHTIYICETSNPKWCVFE